VANSNLKTLSEIFNDKIFRIPDYQRGYSWGNQQLEDLWRDIDNLPLDKSHYTGMITVDIKDNDTYHVIDGQQRLTSLIIFLKNILDLFENDWIASIKKYKAIDKYLYEETQNSKNPTMKFGYYQDNSSYFYYKTNILKIEDKTNKNHETTLYTKNLFNANKFFNDKLTDKTQDELEELFKKITAQLKFNWYEIEKTDDLDEYVIFETMNNRGKPLSVLEILKNRLIYIVTLLDNNDTDKKKLRDDTNDVWKTIFEYLGKDKRMDEDWFLKYHIVMYWGNTFDKKEDLHKTFLLNKFFTIQKVFNEDKVGFSHALNNILILEENYNKFKSYLKSKNTTSDKIDKYYSTIYDIVISLDKDLTNFNNEFEWCDNKEYFIKEYQENDYLDNDIFSMLIDAKNIIDNNYLHYDLIENYISSLKNSIKSYYFILNPQKSNYDTEIKNWLEKINIIGFSEFMPILISIFNNYDKKNKKSIVKILQDIENYLFVKKYCFTKGQQWLNKNFYTPAYNYNNTQNIELLYDDLNALIYDNNIVKNFDKDNFILKIKKLFENEDDKGYYGWTEGLKYVLYEYEISLQKYYNGESKIMWKQINKESIEHIYPQTPKDTWIDDFSNLKGNKQRNKYTNSLGNLLLLSKKKNSKASNKPFRDKKEIYSSGSFNEIEVSKYDKWTTKEIDERGEKILDFMNERWNLGLKVADINKLN